MGKEMLSSKIESLWMGTTPSTNFPELENDIETDVVVIGGGMAGMTAAYFLKQEGLKVVVIEATYIATGTSGNTTAKITSQHGLKYSFLKNHFGKEKAQIYADSNQWAIGEYERIIAKENIDCDFQKIPAYTYTRIESGVEEIKKEVEAAKDLNLQASFVDSIDSFPFGIKSAIKFEEQAYFHPRKFLLAIANIINENESYIFEKTKAIDIQEKADYCEVITDKKNIKAKYVIVATNFPFYDKAKIFSQLLQTRSYVSAVEFESKISQGMFIGTGDRDISFRPHIGGKKKWLVIGEVHHYAKDDENPTDHYKNLERYARDYFGAKSLDYKWAGQDTMSLDGVPYTGQMPAFSRIFMTTGYSAWGMTTSIVSARLLTDFVTGKENKWKELYSPSRLNMPVENFLKDSDEEKEGSLVDLKIDEGRVIIQEREKIAVYKDKAGKINALSAVCTHMGCTVGWNNKDKTWDCPCHGSRYNKEGKVIHGPAVKDLSRF